MKRDFNKKINLSIRSDNGVQFISFNFQNTLIKLKIEHKQIPYTTQSKNTHIESFPIIINDECLSKHEFKSFVEAYKIISKVIISIFHDLYNLHIYFLP
jgi:putative transposase